MVEEKMSHLRGVYFLLTDNGLPPEYARLLTTTAIDICVILDYIRMIENGNVYGGSLELKIAAEILKVSIVVNEVASIDESSGDTISLVCEEGIYRLAPSTKNEGKKEIC